MIFVGEGYFYDVFFVFGSGDVVGDVVVVFVVEWVEVIGYVEGVVCFL